VLYRYSEVFRSSLLITDMTLVAGSWLAAYFIRFHTVFDAPLGIPDFQAYLPPLLVIIPLWIGLFRARGLYEPQRTGSLPREASSILRANTAGVVVLVAITFFLRSYFYSRGVVALFYALATVSVLGFRLSGRLWLRALRKRGYNLRFVIVVGAGRLAEEVIDRIHAHPELGLRARGVLSETGSPLDRRLHGVPIIGDYSQIKAILHRPEERIDQVLIALARDETNQLEKVLADLDDEVVTVRLVPDLLHVMTLRSSVEELDGLPMISLRQSPLVGWSAVQKRAFDVVVASLTLAVAAPFMALIALATWLSSGRPIFYAQQRMGLDGHVFTMYKFRTMVQGAEHETGPIWARPDDARRTKLGAILRRLSFDELPQLLNVLRGDMSLVGPRPERPVFIERFRREIPGYMLRHKVKAGVTGWAQVRGLRGNTSLHARIEHDIHYIQNWSLRLDLRILWLTLWRTWFHRDAG
jgi:Undecaprenyl-phosphate glucose phosphotransferase